MRLKSAKRPSQFNGGQLLAFFKGHRVLVGLLLLVALAGYSLGMVYYGVLLNKNKRITALNDLVHELSVKHLEVIGDYFNSVTAEPEKLIIDIKFKNIQKLAYLRQIALDNGLIPAEVKDQDIPAKITHNDKTYPVKLQLTGHFIDHLLDPQKWSFRVKVKGENTLFGMKEFGLLKPETRGKLSEWIGHQLLEREGLINMRFDYVDVTINGDHVGVYALEEHFEKRLIENNRLREGIIFKPIVNNLHTTLDQIKPYNAAKVAQDPTQKAQLTLVKNQWSRFLSGQLDAGQLFAIDQLAVHYALSDLLNGHHVHDIRNVRFYYNPVTGLLEPIVREWGDLRYANVSRGKAKASLFIEHLARDEIYYSGFFHRRIFKDPDFLSQYFANLQRLSRPEYLDQFLADIGEEMEQKLHILYRDNPAYAYPTRFLYNHQSYIRSRIDPVQAAAVAHLRRTDGGKLLLGVRLLQDLPVEVVGVDAGDSLFFHPTAPALLLPAKISGRDDYQAVEVALPPGLQWADSLRTDLALVHKVPGTDLVRRVPVITHPPEAVALNAPINLAPNHSAFDFVEVDQAAKTLNLARGRHVLRRTLILPPGYTVTGGAGVELDLRDGASIISYSPLRWRGSADQPLRVFSADSTGQGLAVLNAGQPSNLQQVVFENLANPAQSGWLLTGAVTFYQSPVTILQCQFVKNRSEDGLNIMRAEFSIAESLFKETRSDAFDADFTRGSVTATSFVDCGNDAVDVSGTAIELQSLAINGAGDKALSAGEDSQMRAADIAIRQAEIGVASKDRSTVDIRDVALVDTRVGFVIFQKKPEFGGAHITAAAVKSENVEMLYLIEAESSMDLDRKPLAVNHQNVKEILYGVEYGKSSK